MKDELEKKLAEAFPFMQIKETLEEQEAGGRICDLYGAFGCECGDGWYELLYGLCGEITEAYKKHSAPMDIVIDQIKEKYGTLRFYYHLSQNDSDLRREISDIVIKWEKKSAEICERCGKAGVLREDLPWVQTLCDKCYREVT